MSILYVLMGDRHGGLRNGLIMPGTELVFALGTGAERKETPELSDWSRWLWSDVYLPGVEKAKTFAADDVYLLDMGDICHGARYVSEENLYSPFSHNQEEISVMTFTPWREVNNVRGALLAHGTGAHDFGANAAAIRVAGRLAAWGWEVATDDHFEIVRGDIRIDMAHHGTQAGNRKSLAGNTARAYAKDVMQVDYLEFGKTPPNVICRGHVHRPVHETINLEWGNGHYRCEMIITPPLCGPNGYARQATRSVGTVRAGMYYVLVDGKHIEIDEHIVARSTRRTYILGGGGGNVAYSSGITEAPDYNETRREARKKKKKKAAE